MRTSIIPSDTLHESSFRIDASYHSSDGMNVIRNFLRSVNNNTLIRLDKLGDVSNMFVGDWLKRIYVEDPEHGAPYISGDNILKMDPLAGCKYLSFRHGGYIQQLSLQERMILMSCSGTIGRILYVNSSLAGTVGSPDLLRIQAKLGMILPGYLYAFLSSGLGTAFIQKGVYGAVIQHIEIPYMATIPIPRLDPGQEEEIHRLIEQAAELRVRAASSIQVARNLVEKEVGFSSYSKKNDHAFSVEEATLDVSSPFRLDSFYYSGYCAEALRTLDKYPGIIMSAKDVGYRIYNPPLFKRQFAESGFPYMSGVDFYNMRPKTDRFLSKNQPDVDLYLVRKGTVLVQSAGQRYGLITTPLMVTRVLDGVAITSDVVRIDHNDLVENGYICGLFGSGFGRRLALRYSYGTSIPRLDVPEFSGIKIPWPEDEVRRNIGQIVVDAYQQFDLANEMEDQAQELLVIAMSS